MARSARRGRGPYAKTERACGTKGCFGSSAESQKRTLHTSRLKPDSTVLRIRRRRSRPHGSHPRRHNRLRRRLPDCGRRQDRRRDGLQRRHRAAGRRRMPGRRKRAEIGLSGLTRARRPTQCAHAASFMAGNQSEPFAVHRARGSDGRTRSAFEITAGFAAGCRGPHAGDRNATRKTEPPFLY